MTGSRCFFKSSVRTWPPSKRSFLNTSRPLSPRSAFQTNCPGKTRSNMQKGMPGNPASFKSLFQMLSKCQTRSLDKKHQGYFTLRWEAFLSPPWDNNQSSRMQNSTALSTHQKCSTYSSARLTSQYDAVVYSNYYTSALTQRQQTL